MGKKKTPAERKAAAQKFEQRNGAQAENRRSSMSAADAHIELAPLAATFLLSGGGCIQTAQQASGLKPRVIENISRGRFTANADQASGVYTAATSQGWIPPNKG